MKTSEMAEDDPCVIHLSELWRCMINDEWAMYVRAFGTSSGWRGVLFVLVFVKKTGLHRGPK
jgi:hypothetical protein